MTNSNDRLNLIYGCIIDKIMIDLGISLEGGNYYCFKF